MVRPDFDTRIIIVKKRQAVAGAAIGIFRAKNSDSVVPVGF